MAKKKTSKQQELPLKGGTEFFYIDKAGKKQDAALHADMLGDDVTPWDIDLDALADMTPEEQSRYLGRRDELMAGVPMTPAEEAALDLARGRAGRDQDGD